MSRGQALVEFAIVLPLLLFMALGCVAIEVLVIQRMLLQHAAIEGAVVAAEEGCDAGAVSVSVVLGYDPDEVACTTGSGVAEVTITHKVGAIIPVIPDTVIVTGRSIVSPEPSPSP